MKTKTYLFALMTMALTLGSCSDNENGIGGETSKYITVSTSIGNMTRVATDEKGGQTFEEGDEISVVERFIILLYIIVITYYIIFICLLQNI